MTRVDLRSQLFIPKVKRVPPQARPLATSVNYIFTYGTLCRGFWNFRNNIPASIQVEGGARIHGLLFKLGEDAIVVLADDIRHLKTKQPLEAGHVRGNLLRLPSSPAERQVILKRLDIVEGVTGIASEKMVYRRVQVTVYRKDRSMVTAWAYVATSATYKDISQNTTLLPRGDWLRYWKDQGAEEARREREHGRQDYGARLDRLIKRGQLSLDTKLDASPNYLIRQLIEEGNLSAAKRIIDDALSNFPTAKGLSAVVTEWVERHFNDYQTVANYGNFDDLIIEAMPLLRRAAIRAHFTISQTTKILKLLNELICFEHEEMIPSYKEGLLKIAGNMLRAQTVRKKIIRSYIRAWATSLENPPASLRALAQEYVKELSLTLQARGSREDFSFVGRTFLRCFQDPEKKVAVKEKIVEEIPVLAGNFPAPLRARLLATLKAELIAADSAPYKYKIARTILRLSRAAKLLDAIPHLLEKGEEKFITLANDIKRKRTQPERFFPALLKSPQKTHREAAMVSLHAAGKEAVSFAVRELGILERADSLVFLEGVLWAAHGTSFEKTKSRIRKVVEFHRRKTAEIAEAKRSLFVLRKGFEIEWWPESFGPLPATHDPHPLTTTLKALRLLTTQDGFGEYASFPSYRIELQIHVFELIRRLGLFPPNISNALHLNIGLPFKIPFYLFQPQEFDHEDIPKAPKSPKEHPVLYKGLSLIWFPLGLLYMSDSRWNNMQRLENRAETSSIRVPFFFHEENVLGGDKSRLEYRVFEAVPNWQRRTFAKFSAYLHHLSVAFFWKELDYICGTSKTRPQYRELGSIWGNYAQAMQGIIESADLLIPNYFANPFANPDAIHGFHRQLKDYRAEHPVFKRKIRRVLASAYQDIDRIIGLPLDLSLPMPPPLFSNPQTFLV